MVGFAPLTSETPEPKVKMWKYHMWQTASEPANIVDPGPIGYGPSTSFGKEMVRLHPSMTVGVVNCARGSTTMAEWLPTASPTLPVTGLYQRCLSELGEALQTDPTTSLAGILVMQGESDAYECDGNWPVEFRQLIDFLRTDLPVVPIVFGQLGPMPNSSCGGQVGYQQFRDLQATINFPGVRMIQTIDLPTIPEGVHFNTQGQQILGQRFAEAL